jgi:ribosome maturation factor RimP
LSKREIIEKKTEELLLPIVEQEEIEIYDVEYVREATIWYLRVFLMKPEGVTIQDCEKVSRAMSEILDELDYIEEAFIFEVSSPGLGRTLKKDKHLAMSIGEEVEIRTYKAINKQKEFIGTLEEFDKEKIVIKIENDTVEFQRTDIALIRLTLDF